MARWKPQPRDLNPARLRRETVTLDDGDIVVREMTTREATTQIQKAQRPAQAGGGVDQTEDTVWSCILSCFYEDGDDMKPCWGNPPTPDDIRYILGLRAEELGRINRAIRRVNGLDEEELEQREAFTSPSEAGTPSQSPLSASDNSTAAPKR